METVKVSYITDWKNIVFLFLNPFNVFIKQYCSIVSAFVSPLSLFINRYLRVGFYHGIIINNNRYASRLHTFNWRPLCSNRFEDGCHRKLNIDFENTGWLDIDRINW